MKICQQIFAKILGDNTSPHTKTESKDAKQNKYVQFVEHTHV